MHTREFAWVCIEVSCCLLNSLSSARRTRLRALLGVVIYPPHRSPEYVSGICIVVSTMSYLLSKQRCFQQLTYAARTLHQCPQYPFGIWLIHCNRLIISSWTFLWASCSGGCGDSGGHCEREDIWHYCHGHREGRQ